MSKPYYAAPYRFEDIPDTPVLSEIDAPFDDSVCQVYGSVIAINNNKRILAKNGLVSVWFGGRLITTAMAGETGQLGEYDRERILKLFGW